MFVSLTLYDGSIWEDAFGTLDASGALSLTVDASLLADGNLTATATVMNASGSMSSSTVNVVKDTVPPAAPIVSLPAYVNLNNRTAVPLQVSGEAGAIVNVTVTDGVSTLFGRAVVGTGGSVALGLDLSSLRDGSVVAMVTLTDAAGNTGAIAQAASIKNTGAPGGNFTINNNGPVLNGTQATANPNLTLQLAFSNAESLTRMAFSTNSGATYGASVAYAATGAVTLPGGDGLYNVAVLVTDIAGNSTAVMRTIRLDRAAPVIAASLPAPNNATFYDVGAKITLSYSATDVDGAVTTVVLDGTTSITGGVIDIDTLKAGTHTIVVMAVDGLGNTSSTTLTFTIHATVNGLINAVNDGAARGLITSTEQSNLIWYLQKAVANNARIRLQQFVYEAQSQSGKTINAAYAALLVNWAQDLLARTP